MQPQFKIGDVVELKSGSLPMTVDMIDWVEEQALIKAIWFWDGSICEKWLVADCLQLVQSPCASPAIPNPPTQS